MAFATSPKRADGGSKRVMKEKVVQIYERFFEGEDPTRENQHFWEELFLLKPNVHQLQAEILRLNDNQIAELRNGINKFFAECVRTLDHEHHIRILYALQTLCALISGMYKKNHGDCGFDVINALIGFNVAEKRMHQLLSRCNDFLTGEWPYSLKSVCLKLLLLIVTGTDNVSQNTLLEYLMIDNIFETLIKLLSDAECRSKFGHDVIMLLTLLANYRKYETSNPYVVKLSLVDNELSLNGYGLVIAHSLVNFCRLFITNQVGAPPVKWLLSLTNMVGGIFPSDENNVRLQHIRANSGVLLALYEIVHLNRNFITILAHNQTDTNTITDKCCSSSPVEIGNASRRTNGVSNAIASAPATTTAAVASDVCVSEPLNLLITVLQYCSIVMQDIKSEESGDNVKLCFIILTCITEDQYANSVMHDFNLMYKVQLFRMPMRHRQILQEKQSQPVAATLLDLLCEFMTSHLMKRLPTELYQLCIGIVHRLLCYEKKSNVRISYCWKELWEALILVLKFLFVNESFFAKKLVIFNLILQIINIFNLFITYGDTFLASPRSYDLLYYEIIRMHSVFENIYSLALKYSSIDGDFKDVIDQIVGSLINVRAIINHFSPKIEKWIEEHSSSPTEDEVTLYCTKELPQRCSTTRAPGNN